MLIIIVGFVILGRGLLGGFVCWLFRLFRGAWLVGLLVMGLLTVSYVNLLSSTSINYATQNQQQHPAKSQTANTASQTTPAPNASQATNSKQIQQHK